MALCKSQMFTSEQPITILCIRVRSFTTTFRTHPHLHSLSNISHWITYDDGTDVDRDFVALGLELHFDESKGVSIESEASSSSIIDERVVESQKKQRTAAWAVSPNHGIVFDDTWKIVDDLEYSTLALKRYRLFLRR